jgi:hypothetical protein
MYHGLTGRETAQIERAETKEEAGAMSQTLTLELSDEEAEEVSRIAREERRSVGEVGARMINEGLRQNRFPYIEFRTILGERVACVKGRLEVWQVMMIARLYTEETIAKTAEHLVLRPEQVQCALDYYAAYPEEIDAALAENDRNDYETLKRRRPRLQRYSVTDEDLASVQLDDSTL